MTVSIVIDFLAVFFSACCVYPNSLCIISLRNCNDLRDHGHPCKLPDLWPPNSPDVNPIEYKIWVTIQQRIQRTKVQDVKDLMQHLIDAWDGVEESVIQNVIDHRVSISIPAFSHRRILWIFTVTKISMIVKIKLKFIVKWAFLSDYRHFPDIYFSQGS